MRNKAGVLANKQNMDLGYQGEEANALMQLGAGEQQANWNTMDWNAQSLANKRNMWRSGLSQLSQYSQNKEMMANQKERDSQKAGLIPDIFGAVTPYMQGLQDIFNSIKQQQDGN